jgi:hypothetical protein
MSNRIVRIKKILIGIALLAPLFFVSAAGAQVTQRDVLVKGAGSDAAVYYLAADGKRYVFPNQKTYDTWFSNFNGVITVSPADLSGFPLGGNVTYRPGIRLVKITTDPKTYAVDAGGTLRWVTSESAAASLYGSDWNTKVDDIPDAFFTNYHVGANINAAADFSPYASASAAVTINSDLGIPQGASPVLSDTTPSAPAAQAPVAAACTADVWTCSAWDGCGASGTQTRTCSLAVDCPNVMTPSPALSQPCAVIGTSVSDSVNETDDTGNVVADSGAVLAEFRLNAADEDLRLTKASFNVASPDAVLSLQLFDGDIPVSSSATADSNGDAFFSGVNFIIPRDTSKNLTVRGVLNKVGPDGVASGANAKVTMEDTGGPYVFEMRGTETSTVITALPGGAQAGNDKIVRKSVPTVSDVALPSTILTQGEVVAARVRIGASASGDVGIKTLTVDVQKPNDVAVSGTGDGTHSTVRVYGAGENLVGQSDASAGCAAGGGTFCQIRTEFADEEDLAAGSAKTYDVRVNVSGALADGDSLATVLDGDAQVLTGALSAGSNADQVAVSGTDADFAWSDLSAASHDSAVGASSADWASGAYVMTLPTDVQVMVK